MFFNLYLWYNDFLMPNFLANLNPAQKEAVKKTEGPILILAGAGSGKTRCLTYKIAYLIRKKGVNPQRILAVTFTNKAAEEMKKRVEKLLGGKAKLPLISTFHSLCAQILRKEGKHIGLPPNFIIFDTLDQSSLIKKAIRQAKIEEQFSPKAILKRISSAKNELIGEEGYLRFSGDYFEEVVAQIFPYYQKLLAENNALDFDDLLVKTILLLQKNKDVREKYQKRFQYILVDEYQDTNHAQYILTKLLTGTSNNLCVVGDCSQSIYRFRGADFRNVLNLKQDFPNLTIFHLEQNYRSSQNILEAAFSVIRKNKSHPVLRLWTKNPKGEPIFFFAGESEKDEAFFVAQTIQEQLKRASLSDFAILFRTNAQSRIFEETLLQFGLPYLLVGGINFYERREIKDILAFLRLLWNPKDRLSSARIEKLGKRKAKDFFTFVQTASWEGKTTLEILNLILKETNYLARFDPHDPADFSRLENIRELCSVAVRFPKLSQFLEKVTLIQQEHLPNRRATPCLSPPRAITLMTVHAAKGLEFPVVFMVGMEEGLFPHSRSLWDREELEEERRLCYVGMTRAKKSLYLTSARRRLYLGLKTTNPVSRFVQEIPKNLLRKISL